jgi:hypothetical protein
MPPVQISGNEKSKNVPIVTKPILLDWFVNVDERRYFLVRDHRRYGLHYVPQIQNHLFHCFPRGILGYYLDPLNPFPFSFEFVSRVYILFDQVAELEGVLTLTASLSYHGVLGGKTQISHFSKEEGYVGGDTFVPRFVHCIFFFK